MSLSLTTRSCCSAPSATCVKSPNTCNAGIIIFAVVPTGKEAISQSHAPTSPGAILYRAIHPRHIVVEIAGRQPTADIMATGAVYSRIRFDCYRTDRGRYRHALYIARAVDIAVPDA